MSQIETAIVIGIIAVLLVGYVRLARRDAPPQTLKGFFLGGAKIGPELTEANTLGITFAWSGGIWYFAWLAYQFGPIVLLSQLFWVFSLVLLAIFLPRILPHVRNRTLHGFLGEAFGVRTQIIAAGATTAGYVLNCGFEIFWSSKLFAASLGRVELALPTACMLALVVASYCSIGGYKSSASIDKPQNLLGVFALGLYVFFVSRSVQAPAGLISLSSCFLAGASAYCVISLLVYAKVIAATKRLLDVVAIGFAVAAVVITIALFFNPEAFTRTDSFAQSYKSIPMLFLVATIPFQIFFNVVDMQNWQQIAANGDLPERDRLGIMWSIIRAALYLFWFPALGGVLLGCLLKAASGGLTDATIFTAAAGLVLPTSDGVVRALVFGVIFAGLLSSALSTADSLLMSAIQTIFYDVKERNRVAGLLATPGQDADESGVVARAKRWLVPLTLVMVLLFFGLYYKFEGDVFLFQSLMYAMPLTLLAPVVLGLWGKQERFGAVRGFVFWGIAVGLLLVIVMAAIAMFMPAASTSHLIGGTIGFEGSDKDWLMALTPVAANVCALLFTAIGLAITRKAKARLRMPIVRIATSLFLVAACAGIATLCWMKLENEPFALYSGFMTLAVLMWIFQLPRPSWLDAKELEDLLARAGRILLGRKLPETSSIDVLKRQTPVEIMFRSATYIENSRRLCTEIYDIGREKFMIYIGVGLLALFLKPAVQETPEVMALKIVSSILIFGTPLLLSLQTFSKQKQFNEELLTRAKTNGI